MPKPIRLLSRVIALFLLLIIASSCSTNRSVTSSGVIQKRKYQKGYHVSLGANKEKKNERAQVPEAIPGNSGGMVSTGIDLPEKLPLQEMPDGDNDCDIITKQDGEEVRAKVKKIGPEMIEYKKCGREDGPTYTIKKSSVFMIKYPDGEKDVFGQGNPEEKEKKPGTRERFPEKESQEKDKSDKEKEENQGNNAFDVIGFIFSIVAFIFFLVGMTVLIDALLVAIVLSILGIIFSSIGNGGLGDAGLVISIINLVLSIAAVLIVIALLM